MRKDKLSGVFWIALMGLGLAASVFAAMNAAGQVGAADGWRGWLQGHQTLAFEKKYDENLVHYDASVQLWGIMTYALFGEGSKGVLIGDNGWLFTNEEFMAADGMSAAIAAKIDYIAGVRDRLKLMNVSLFVVAVPAKARVYARRMGRHAYPSYLTPVYGDFLAALRARSIPAVDLLPVLSRGDDMLTYLKTDTHWTPEGARASAQAVAAAITSAYPYLSFPSTSFTLKRTGEKEHRGDLMRYTPFGRLEKTFGLAPDILSIYEISSADDDLFGNDALPLTLVGTSYSANENWPFAGFLKEALQTDLINAADEGLGPFEVMEKYLISDELKTNSPKLLIWEIPERYLSVAYDVTTETN